MFHSFKLNLMILILFIGIISFSIFLTINAFWIYYLNLKFLNLGAKVNLSNYQLMRTYLQILKYLQLPWKIHLNLIYFSSSIKGLHHFSDVKKLILFNNIVMLPTFVTAIIFYKYLLKNKKTWLLIKPCQEFLLMLSTMLFLFVLDFNDLFIMFHKIIFHNNDWVFNSKFDPIIKVLPSTFFFQLFIFAFIIIAFILIIIIGRAKHKVKLFLHSTFN